MIISDKYKYVYIAIPRTGSKSMNHWLCDHFDGRWYGGHHDYLVPEEAADYFVFTIVRNPYDRAVSHHFAIFWAEQSASKEELKDCHTTQERLQKTREVLKTRERQGQKDLPQQSTIPLDQRLREAVVRSHTQGFDMNQKSYVDLARVNMVLHFEHLPQCLTALPFVDPNNMPPLLRHPERGIRPKGNFFDLFRETDEEQVVWAYAAEDFEAFGYRRFDCGLPPDVPDALQSRQLTQNTVSR